MSFFVNRLIQAGVICLFGSSGKLDEWLIYLKCEGREEGVKRGVQKGELAGQQKVLIRQLDKKFGLPADDKELILSTNNPEQLD